MNAGEQTSETTANPEHGGTDQPRIYVASLSDYNAGILHGNWLPAAVEPAELWDGIKAMLAASPSAKRYGDVAEEWAIHDYEGFSPYVPLGEYESIERVAALARGLVAHGDAFAAWWAMEPPEETDDDELEAAFEEHYLGEYASLEDYGQQMLDDMGINTDDLPDIPEGLRPYVRVDVEAWTRDMVLGGDISTAEAEGGVYVFWGM